MYRKIKLLFNLLTTRQRRNFFLLQIFVILMAFMEIIGVASIIPFMSLVGDITKLEGDTFISQIYQNTGIASKSHFIFYLAFCTHHVVCFSNNLNVYYLETINVCKQNRYGDSR